MANEFLGIDIAKDKFDVALLRGNDTLHAEFANEGKGFKALKKWLKKNRADGLHICMEATGSYWFDIAEFLCREGFLVSVVNPAQVKYYGKSELVRTKTDKVDAALIARFCRVNSPRTWIPRPAHMKQLREKVRLLEFYKSKRKDFMNRIKVPGLSGESKAMLKKSLDRINADIKKIIKSLRTLVKSNLDLKESVRLIKTIPGAGEVTSWLVLSEAEDVENYDSARQLAAHAGLTPRHHESGSSIRGKARMSKVGNALLRKGLYMPAVVAKNHNPVIKSFAERLLLKGKPGKVVIVAAMRKLLHIIYGVLKNRKAFDPELQPTCIGI